MTISRSATTVRPIVAPVSATASTSATSTGAGTVRVMASAVPSDSNRQPGSVAPDDERGDLVVVAGDGESGARDRLEHRPPGARVIPSTGSPGKSERSTPR